MAYVVENSGVSKDGTGTGSAFTCPISSLAQQDDVAVVAFMRQNGAAATAPAGWQTVVVENSALSIFYKNQTATPDTSVGIPTTATDGSICTFLVRGCDVSTATSAYDAGSYAAVNGSTAVQITGPSITPSNANSTIIMGMGERSGQCMIPSHGAKYVAGIHAGSSNILLIEDFQSSASATTGYVWHRNHTGTTGINAVFSFAMNDAGNSELKPYIDWNANPPVTPVHFMGLSGESGISSLDTAQYNPTTEIPSITDGNGSPVSTIYDALGSQNNILQRGTYSTLTNSNSAAASVSGTVLNSIPSLTGKNICFSTKPRFTIGISPYNEVGAYFILSDQTNSRVWMYAGNETSPNVQEGVYPVVIDPDGGYEWEDIGTVTLSNCDTIVVGYNKPSTDNETMYYSPIVLLETLNLSGGTSTTPASMLDLRQIAQLNRLNTVLNQGGQTEGQFICFQDIEIVTDYWDGSTQATAYPQAYNETQGYVQTQIADGSLSFLFNAPDGATVIDKNKVYDMGSYHSVGFKSGTSTDVSTTYDVNGATWLNCTPYLNAISGALEGLLIAGSKEVVYTTLADCTGGVTFSGCVDTYQITVASQAELENLQNCDFQNNNYSIRITGNHGGQTWSLTGATVSGGTGSYDIRYEGAGTLTIEADSGSGWIQSRAEATVGTLTISAPTLSLTVNSNVAASDIKIFNTGTQTVEASTTGTTLSTTNTGTYDITVMKAGYLPQRQTGVALGGSSVTVNFTLIEDPIYSGGHGLTYTTDFSYSRSTQKLTLSTRQEGRDFYSALIDNFISQSSLDNTQFDFQAVGPDSIFFLNGAEIIDSASEDNWKGAGIRYLNSSSVVTAEWCSVKSSGTIPAGGQGEYQQVAGSGTTDLRATGAVDQIIQIYGDATHGNFNYRGHLVIKYQVNGYREVRADVPVLAGVSTLEPFEYSVALEPVAISAATGDPAIALTVTDHGASPVTWNGKQFSITVQYSGADSGEDILRELNYNLSLDTTYQGKDPFNWSEMVVEAGSAYETLRGITEGGVGATLKGVRVVNGSGDPHPDFTRFQADDGTYYVVPVTNSVSITNIVSGSRLRIYNETTATEIYNNVPGTSYADTYTEGTDYTAGDIVKIYLTQTATTTAQLPYSATIVAGASGWSALADQQGDDVYNGYAIDGSTITKFTADYVNDEVDLTVASNFAGDELYAWWTYNLTTSQGISDFFGGLTAQDSANLLINNSVVSIYLDNTTTTNVYQTDNIRVYRADGAYPVKNPTTGGGGIDVVWRDRVYIAETGVSGLTPTESSQLAEISSVNTKIGSPVSTVSADIANLNDFDPAIDTVARVTLVDTTTANADMRGTDGANTVAPDNSSIAAIKGKTDQLTFTKANELDSNIQSVNDVTVSGTGSGGDEWGPA